VTLHEIKTGKRPFSTCNGTYIGYIINCQDMDGNWFDAPIDYFSDNEAGFRPLDSTEGLLVANFLLPKNIAMAMGWTIKARGYCDTGRGRIKVKDVMLKGVKLSFSAEETFDTFHNIVIGYDDDDDDGEF
jgi:hypothetical protein